MQVRIESNGINLWANKLYFAKVRSFIKWRNFHRNCVNRTYGIYQSRTRILRKFSAQARNIYLIIPNYIHYVMSHSKNILKYICKQYISIIQRNVAAEFASILNININIYIYIYWSRWSTACTVNHLSMSQCCPLLPRYPPHCSCTAIEFVCVHLYYWNWGLSVGCYEVWRFYSSVNVLQPM